MPAPPCHSPATHTGGGPSLTQTTSDAQTPPPPCPLTTTTTAPSQQQEVAGCGWTYQAGTARCDGLSLEDLREELRQEYGHRSSPVHIYSRDTLLHNVKKYLHALAPLGSAGVLSYSLKANSNPHLVRALRGAGVTRATCVSGNEVKVALSSGFPPSHIILNGNGKQRWEVEEAVNGGSLLNVDSLFDARLVVAVAESTGLRARVLLRLNPALDGHTHAFLATALPHSKFGVEESQVDQVLAVLRGDGEGSVEVEGVHLHIGSAISCVSVYAHMTRAATRILRLIQDRGWPDASIVNLGGGLAVSHAPPATQDEHLNGTTQNTREETPPTPQDLMAVVLPLLPDGVTLILEPGRSLVATAGVVLTEVLGVKSNGGKVFVVVDAAMTEVIRPALYGAAHPVTLLTLPQEEGAAGMGVEVEVVGPVCESGDFLAQGCLLPAPPTPGEALLVWGTGAYCAAMASNYNMRPHALEVMVQGHDTYKVIRRPQLFEDLFKEYQ